MDIVSLLAAFGLRSIATALVQAWLTTRHSQTQRSFEERKEAYIGLLDVFGRFASKNSDDLGKQFAYWEVRCALVGPPELVNSIAELKETPTGLERQTALDGLIRIMRKDLGVAL